MRFLRIAAVTALTGLAALAQDNKQPPKEIAVEAVALGRAADFAQDILPILKSKCLACHNAKDKEADLILESPPHMLKGGESGPAVVVGKPDESLLLKTSAHRAKPYMPPPRNKIGAVAMTPRELGLLKLWIAEGAKGSVAAAQLLP
ncbi:MAG TPA: c-type cytochrome domain-containing protein, partial [Planctomycetota bacterium]